MSVVAWAFIISVIIGLGGLFCIISFGIECRPYLFFIGAGLVIAGLIVGAFVLQQCPNCSSTQLESSHYCTVCGYDFEEDTERYWECGCGNKLPVSYNYCPDCGSFKENK